MPEAGASSQPMAVGFSSAYNRLMDNDAVLRLFDKLNVWSRGDQRAPHKPLLVLYALGRWSRGETADIPFKQVDADLTGLLKEFGPPRQSYHTEYPFWRLQNDDVWVVHATGPLIRAEGRFPQNVTMKTVA
jgi:putative restriction endonuclease